MRNKFIHLVTLLVFITGFVPVSSGQDFLPTLNDNFMGINQVFLQPAAIADSRLRYDFNIAGFSNDISNDGIHFRSKWLLYPTSMLTNEDWWDEFTYMADPNGKDKNLFMSQSALGPGFLATLSPKHSIGFTSRVRSILNIDGMDEPLFRLLYSNYQESDYYNKWYYNREMRSSQHIFGDYGLTYARIIPVKNQEHFFKAGITVKLLQGIAASYLQTDELYYYFNGEAYPGSKDMSYNSPQLYSGLSDNWGYPNEYGSYTFSMNYQLTAKPSVGLDFGAVYEFRRDMFGKGAPDSADPGKNKYFLKLGFSVLDLGRLKYEKDYYSSDYHVAFTPDYLNRFNTGDNSVPENTSWLDANDVSFSFRDYPDFSYAMHQRSVNGQGLQKSASDKEKFTVRLPAAISLQADINLFLEGLYVNYTSYHGLYQGYKNAPNSHYISSYSITPRYEHKWYSVAVPVQIDQYGKLNVGLGVRAGVFYLGVNNLFSNIFSDPYGMHAYVGVKVPVHYKKDKPIIIDISAATRDSIARPDKLSGDITIIKDSFNKTIIIDDHSDNSRNVINDGASGDAGKGISGSGSGQGDGEGTAPGGQGGSNDQTPGKGTISPVKPGGSPGGPKVGPDPGKGKREPLPNNSHVPNIISKNVMEGDYTITPIYFAFGDSKNSQEHNLYLDSLAFMLMSQPELKISIEGHTDNIGSDEFNMKLSKIRALETRNYLINKGVSADQLSVKWFGESKPLNEELKDTQEGRDMNRRVEFRIEKQT